MYIVYTRIHILLQYILRLIKQKQVPSPEGTECGKNVRELLPPCGGERIKQIKHLTGQAEECILLIETSKCARILLQYILRLSKQKQVPSPEGTERGKNVRELLPPCGGETIKQIKHLTGQAEECILIIETSKRARIHNVVPGT